MKPQFNHRNYRQNNLRNGMNSFRYQPMLLVAMSISLLTFGMVPYSFLRDLVIVGGNPMAGLTTRQMKDMYWLHYMC